MVQTDVYDDITDSLTRLNLSQRQGWQQQHNGRSDRVQPRILASRPEELARGWHVECEPCVPGSGYWTDAADGETNMHDDEDEARHESNIISAETLAHRSSDHDFDFGHVIRQRRRFGQTRVHDDITDSLIQL